MWSPGRVAVVFFAAACVAPSHGGPFTLPSDSADDSGEDTAGRVDTAPDSDVSQFVVTSGPVVVCADPDARASAPLRPVTWGDEWAGQPPAVAAPDELGGGVTVEDLTGDGRLDVFVPDQDAWHLFVQDAAGVMHEESATRLPTPPAGLQIHASPADIDGDGDLDLLLTRYDAANQLYLNDGMGRFTDVSAASGLAVDGLRSTGSAWGDLDGDGDLDLVITADRDCMVAPDAPTSGVLWRNDGDAVFTDVTGQLPAGGMPPMQGRTPGVVDVDDDGDLDLYFVGDFASTDCNASNLLFLNDGTGTFTDPGFASGVAIRAESMGLALGDLNGDDLVDFVVSDASKLDVLESLGGAAWYASNAARRLVFDANTLRRYDPWGLALADLDDDGDLDIPAVYGAIPGVDAPNNWPEQADAIYLQGDDGTFTDVGAAWGFADPRSMRGLVVTDLDGDGWLDLVRRELGGPAEAWLGVCGDAHWIELSLEGPAPDTRAVGAVVEVVAGEHKWRRFVTGGGTSLYSTGPSEVHVGLGDAEVVDVTVRWPDGVVSEHPGLPADRRVSITRAW